MEEIQPTETLPAVLHSANPPVKKSEPEVIGAECIHNVDSQPDFMPSAPPEEQVTGLYPSLEGVEETLNSDDAPKTQETSETPRLDKNREIAEDKEKKEYFKILQDIARYSKKEESPQPPETVCVSCLIPGHQGGRECKWPQYECKNCGYEHAWKILCKEVEFTLKYGGNPLNLAPRKKTKDTPMEDLCPNCFDLRHHSRMPCEKKEPP